MDDGIVVEVVHSSHDAVLEFLFGGDADVAQRRSGELGEEALDEVEPRAMFRREGEFEAMRRLGGKPGCGFFGMIVEDQLDRSVGRIGGVEQLEKFDEFAAAVTILDQGMNLAANKIDAGQQADRAVAFIFKLPGKGCS